MLFRSDDRGPFGALSRTEERDLPALSVPPESRESREACKASPAVETSKVEEEEPAANGILAAVLSLEACVREDQVKSGSIEGVLGLE